MDAEDVLHRLRTSATVLERLDAPTAAGVYASFLAPGAGLPGVSSGHGGPLYVGVSRNLAEREFETHFATGQTGFSTLRRSIGAILKEQLELRARARGVGASKTNFTNYRFDDAGEQRLTAWMRAHLIVAVEPFADPMDREREMIALARPPLNLKGWANPQAGLIKALRTACADEARAAFARVRAAPEADDWGGEPVAIARSPSGVMLLRDYADNLIRTDGAAWPPPALVAKLVAADRVSARWPAELRDAVSGRLGY